MRTFFAVAVIVAIAPRATAKVWTTVYRCDETTPLALVDPNRPAVYREVMAGIRLVIVINSDTGEYWLGHVRLSWNDAAYATLSGRGPTIVPPLVKPTYKGSCLEATGAEASVIDYSGPRGVGLEFGSSYSPPVYPGDWFILDYRAERIGACEVGLYDLLASPDVPIEILAFTHVPSRDFDGDTIVNFEDFALFAGRWRSLIDPDPNGPDASFDLDADGRIDIGDTALFSEYWLERIDCDVVGITPSAKKDPFEEYRP